MKIIKTDADSLKKTVSLLRNGGIIVYPTDTAYGLGCDALNKKAVKRIYKIKNRPRGKPLPVIAGSLNLAKKFFRFSKKELQLAKKYWPGPLSLVLTAIYSPPYCKGELEGVTGVVVRVPNSKIARFLSSKIKRPIISTSANISGKGECFSVKDVLKQFENKKYQPDLILDAGKLTRRKPSTIIQVKNGKIEILRRGSIIIE
jgi:L-threonylcarbamoyladenylate synthase